MARPTKKGLDYFPLDCHLDIKFKLLEARFGLKGFAIIIKLYQKIYAEEGYFLAWDQDVALVFASDINAGVSVVSEVVMDALKRGIFDKEIFEKYSVLTSKGIQERYLSMTEKRVNSKILDEYTLLSADKKTVYDEETSVFAAENQVNVPGKYTKESKVNKSKVKESKSNKKEEIPYEEMTNDELQDSILDEENWIKNISLIECWEEGFCVPPSSAVIIRLQEDVEMYGKEKVYCAIREAVIYHKNSIDYIEKILISWKDMTTDQILMGERPGKENS